MKSYNKPFVIISALIVSIGAVILFSQINSQVLASGFLNAVNPESVKINQHAIVPPLLAPPPQEVYIPIEKALAESIIIKDGRPVARLNVSESYSTYDVSIYLPNQSVDQDLADTEIYYQVLASVKYTNNDNVILVTTARPSPMASQQPTVFGDQAIELSNGLERIPDELSGKVER